MDSGGQDKRGVRAGKEKGVRSGLGERVVL